MNEETSSVERSSILIERVNDLSEEVRLLALNLALYLAKLKSQTNPEKFGRLEPDFVRLVNGTVRVVKEVTVILDAARNKETMVFEVPRGNLSVDRLETKLHGILEQCQRVLGSLSELDDSGNKPPV